MRLELLEQDVFHTQYQRNNKAKAKKNLRCFPACRHAGHVEAGFCGRPVLVRVHYTVEDLASIGATGISALHSTHCTQSCISPPYSLWIKLA